ncbi:MAG: molybdopterin-dependent oxidoreductase [Hyphomicrobiaceae bacterium]
MSQKRLVSPMRPSVAVDQSLLHERRDLLRSIERRALLRGGLSLGALTLLTGCDITNRDSVQSVLSRMSLWNDRVQAFLFSPTRLAPEFAAADVLKPPRWNAYIGRESVPRVDGASWRLELGGRISDKRPRTLAEIQAMPHVTQRTRHICVEGWDYIGEWSGVPFKHFLESIGADLTAKYVGFRCADKYTGSIDMASALHPQTQLTTKYAGETIDNDFGFPIRLKAPTKLGFKQPKQILAIEVTNTNPGGYWEDRGFNWFSGL